MNDYKLAIWEEMKRFAAIPNSVFLGQQVAAEDFYGTLKDIPLEKRIEMPVAEELQLGMSIGMALEGYLPISVYQRMDFLPRACDQLVNHLDLTKELSCGKFKPKVIIRTTIGVRHPLDTGLQHSKNLIDGFRHLLKNIPVVDVKTPEEVRDTYQLARKIKSSIMIVEYQELYS